jgi:vitamin B12 transporter
MILLLRTFVFGVGVFGCITSIAQLLPDSTTLLDEVVIERQRIEDLALGHFSLKFDSNITVRGATGSVADLMRKFGYGHLRSYGPGGLATLSLRGTGAGHTSVLWNGMPLQSPLNGQLDLSQVPTFFLDDAELQMGGSTTINGNAAIGGTLHLNGQARFNEGLSVQGTAGAASFATWFGGLGQRWSGKNFATETKVYVLDSRNDFQFINNNLAPPREEQREHAAYRQAGILHQDYWQPAANWLLHLRVWMQDNYVELPAESFVFRTSEADQRDKFIRSMIGAQYTSGHLHMNFQSSVVHHELEYRQDLASPVSESTFDTFINTVEATAFYGDGFEITGGLNYTLEQGNADEMAPSEIRRHRVAVFNAFKYRQARLAAVLSVRIEAVKGAAPFVPALGFEYLIAKDVKLVGNISRNYRIPTLNDLYWLGVGAEGNQELRSEESWSEETALHYDKVIGKMVSLSLKATAFSNQVDNWIQWQPDNMVWSPDNIKKVWSRGSEAQATIRVSDGKWTTSIAALYSFTRSTTLDVYDGSAQNEIGKQLIYTPVHEGSTTFNAGWKKWAAAAILNVTGLQFTDADNNPLRALDPYSTLNLWLQREVNIGKNFRSSLILEANNVLGASYESREGYPMPGRNYRLSLNLRIE